MQLSRDDEDALENAIIAAYAGNFSNIKNMLAANPSLLRYENEDNLYMIHRAVIDNSKPFVKFILDKDKSYLEKPDKEEGMTPLMHAAHVGNTEMVEYLLKLGANINAFCTRKCNALFLAVENDNVGTARVLIDRGISILVPQYTVETILHTSMLPTIEGEDEDFILLLLKKGLPIDKLDKDGRTALQVAASRALEGLVRLLLSKGANINHQDKTGKTALHYAIIEDNLSMYDTLCRVGIDQTMKDNEGKKALDYAPPKIALFLVSRSTKTFSTVPISKATSLSSKVNANATTDTNTIVVSYATDANNTTGFADISTTYAGPVFLTNHSA